MKKAASIISEIAENLESGYDCYYNPKTTEMVAIPNDSMVLDEAMLEDAFGEDLKKVNKKNAGFIKIEGLESFESFKIMENFTDQLTDVYLKQKLETALNRKKPFQNFKYVIDNSNYRNDWFDFKHKAIEQIVKSILEVQDL